VRLHGACRHQVSTLIAFLHCDLVRKTFVAKLGVRLQIRAKSLYQLFEVIQFLKLWNPIVRGQFSLGQTLQVIALGQKDTSPFVAKRVHTSVTHTVFSLYNYTNPSHQVAGLGENENTFTKKAGSVNQKTVP
jgi:hypothetical protein